MPPRKLHATMSCKCNRQPVAVLTFNCIFSRVLFKDQLPVLLQVFWFQIVPLQTSKPCLLHARRERKREFCILYASVCGWYVCTNLIQKSGIILKHTVHLNRMKKHSDRGNRVLSKHFWFFISFARKSYYYKSYTSPQLLFFVFFFFRRIYIAAEL